MYFYLLLTIFCATGLFVILKLLGTLNIKSFPVLVINYFIAALISFVLFSAENQWNIADWPEIHPGTLLIGLLFIVVFMITALTALKSGLTVTSVAAKMSMVIPVLAGISIYHEKLKPVNLAGMILALVAVYFTTSRTNAGIKNTPRLSSFLLPAALFTGTGLVDALIKYAQHAWMNEHNRGLIIASMFFGAFIFGFMRLVFDGIVMHYRMSRKEIIAGIILGTINYLSIHFLTLCFESPQSRSSVIFALLNIGVVLLSTLIAVLGFREYPERKNYVGILMAVAAVLLITF